MFDAAFAQMYEDELAEYLDPCDSAEDGVDEMVEMSSDLDESRARKALLMVSEEESVAEALDEIGPIVDYIDDVIQSPIDETEFKYRIDSLDSERVHEIKSAGREKIIRRQQERLERREEVITVLQRILRHNLRNDISVVKGYVSMMESALEDGEVGSGDAFETVYDTIDELIEMSERTHQVTTDLMTNYEQTSLSLADTVRQAVHEVSNDYPQASITVNVEGDTRTYGYPTLETAFLEIVENACSHTDKTPEISISIRAEQQKGIIVFNDNGPGIPEFEQTVLEEGTETPLEHGSGLGLWIVNWIIDDHNGSIDVESSGEGGTKMVVELPRIKADAPFDMGEMDGAEETAGDGVSEDSELNIDLSTEDGEDFLPGPIEDL